MRFLPSSCVSKRELVTLLLTGHFPFFRYGTDDIEFEDMIMWWKGKQEFKELIKLTNRLTESATFDVRSENHGQHEIVMEWTVRD